MKHGQPEARILTLKALPISGVYSRPCISLSYTQREPSGDLRKRRQTQEVCRGLETGWGQGGMWAGRALRSWPQTFTSPLLYPPTVSLFAVPCEST